MTLEPHELELLGKILEHTADRMPPQVAAIAAEVYMTGEAIERPQLRVQGSCLWECMSLTAMKDIRPSQLSALLQELEFLLNPYCAKLSDPGNSCAIIQMLLNDYLDAK